MRRRDFLACSAAATAGLMLPRAAGAARSHDFGGRVVLLIELNGGNDGLNTVVPYADRAYRAARPRLALDRDAVLQLDERVGLNIALEQLMPAWQAGELAIVQGVGYARPNRSHFRSIEIVETASDSDETLQEGWVARAFAEAGITRDLATDGVVLGGPAGPLAGAGVRAVVMAEPDQFLRQAMGTPAGRPDQRQAARGRTALSHLMRVRTDIRAAAGGISEHLERAPDLNDRFPNTEIGRQMRVAARLIAAEVPLAAIKIRQPGYDTHGGQIGAQTRLLGQFAEALAAFRGAMRGLGAWRRVLVMTYAEFGRRVAENASAGTDHGTAAPHFVLGGRVRGGLYGAQPPLDDLDAGDLRHRVDFRRLYATAGAWWNLPPTPLTLKSQTPLDLLKS